MNNTLILFFSIIIFIAIVIGIIGNFRLNVLKKFWFIIDKTSIKIIGLMIFQTILVGAAFIIPTAIDQALFNLLIVISLTAILLMFPYSKKLIDIPLLVIPCVTVISVYSTIKYYILLSGVVIDSVYLVVLLFAFSQILIFTILINNTLERKVINITEKNH